MTSMKDFATVRKSYNDGISKLESCINDFTAIITSELSLKLDELGKTFECEHKNNNTKS